MVTFSNGTKKMISADGKSNSVYFFNGDIKHVKSDQTVVSCPAPSIKHAKCKEPSLKSKHNCMNS